MTEDKKTESADNDTEQDLSARAENEGERPGPPAEQERLPTPSAALDLGEMPPAVQREFRAFSSMFRSQVGPPGNLLFDKFTDAHIDKYLSMIQNDDDHAHELAKSNRVFYLIYTGLTLTALAVAVAGLLPDHEEFLKYVFQILALVAGGIGAGYGVASRRKR